VAIQAAGLDCRALEPDRFRWKRYALPPNCVSRFKLISAWTDQGLGAHNDGV